MITITSKGSFVKTQQKVQKLATKDITAILNRYGEAGVRALASATPQDSGLAAQSWKFEIVQNRRGKAIIWSNTDREKGFPVAIALQYGYATGTGGYVQGRDYINPAIRPIFDQIREAVWKELTR